MQWLRDGLGIIRSSAEVEPLAASVPDTGGVFLVPAFAGLGAPHWDAYARGAIVGLTRGTTAAHIARAALESIAYQVADLAEAMQADAGVPLSELRVDGGAARNDLLLQFQADLMGVAVVASEGHRDHGARRRLPGGPGHGRVEGSRRDRAPARDRPRVRAADASREVAALRARWVNALDRAQGWETS